MADEQVDFNVIDGSNGPDFLQGTDGNDVIRGFNDNDIIFGGGGNDIILGGNNGDVLRGGAGIDILFGGDGEDVLRGGEGNDILAGGLRSDLFVFSGDFGNDIITDFDGNQDGFTFEGADQTNIKAEVFANGTLLTVESDATDGTVLLLGVTEFDEIFV